MLMWTRELLDTNNMTLSRRSTGDQNPISPSKYSIQTLQKIHHLMVDTP